MLFIDAATIPKFI